MIRLRAFLVDDESLALRRLSVTLGEIDDVEIVGSTTSARQAVEMIGSLAPDVIFLDIAMPGLSGFDVLKRLPQAPAIVFVTAYDKHAVRAFGVDAVDYLLKPVAPDRLKLAVERARRWTNGRVPPGADSPSADNGFLGSEDSLWVHRHQEFVRIRVGDIHWIEAQGDYVMLHGANGGGLLRMTLRALEARLDPEDFVRVHRSAICRRKAIVGLKRKSTGALAVSLSNGDSAPVGRTFSAGLRALRKTMLNESPAQS